MSTKRRLRAVLKVNKNNIPLLLMLAQLIYSKMLAAGALFGSPPIPLATLQSQTKDLSDAQAGVKQRAVMASTRDAKRDVLYTTLETELMYVQGLSDNSSEGAAIIEAAGMTIAAFRASPRSPSSSARSPAASTSAPTPASSPARRGSTGSSTGRGRATAGRRGSPRPPRRTRRPRSRASRP